MLYIDDYRLIVPRYIQFIYEQENLLKIFNDHKIPLVILKGTAAAMYYPDPLRRTMWDIDFFVPDEMYESANALMKLNGYTYIDDNHRHTEYVKNHIEFEIHRQFSAGEKHIIDPYLIDGLLDIREYDVNQSKFPGLPPCENVLVFLSHMMQHIKASGLGLRQIIDWMMFVHNELDDETWNYHFRSLAEKTGFEELAVTITFMCKKWLGLPDTITWCDNADEDLADSLISLILAAGNFGNSRSRTEVIGVKMRTRGFFPFLQSAGTKQWKLAQKHTIFRPFAWLYQLLHYCGRGIARLFKGNNDLKGFKESRNIREIIKRLG